MMRRIFTLLAACALITSAAFAGGKDLRNAKSAKLIIDNAVENQARPGNGKYVQGLDSPASLTWVAVDSMANAFGPADDRARPIAYDPATDVLAVLHRGATPYAVSSGKLWYNVSHNGGITWRRVGELNGSATTTCRYPSGAISNPANSADTGQCLFVYSAPNVDNAGGWGYYTYGVDFPLGGGAGSGSVDPTLMGDLSSSSSIWGTYNSNWVMWTAVTGVTGSTTNDTRLWRTDDYVTITSQVPPSWTDALPNFINAVSAVTGLGVQSGSYYAMLGYFGGDDSALAANGGYARSTNNGQTWLPWARPRPDWMGGTGLPPHYDMYNFYRLGGNIVSWNSDFTADANGRGHFFHVVVDSPWTEHDPRGILEVYETAADTWAYKWVTQNLNTYTALGYIGLTGTTPYLDQTHTAVTASISPDGQVIALVWLDAATSAPADSLPDIWFSWRRINGSAWSTPENLTQTPGFPELLLHTAPIMKHDGGITYTMFLGRSYQSNINTYPPDNNVKTTFFVASHTFDAIETGVKETGQQPSAFRLEQNYPNPFNPSTTIRYSIGAASHVTLKVYNTLGQEVATLVDENQSVGEHQAKFDAANLSSGIYLYKITAGSNTESMKMVLLK